MRPKKRRGVYVIVCKANGMQYVGSATDISNRWGSHRWGLRHGRHPNPVMQADWDTHGEAAFEFKMVAEIQEPGMRRTVEQAYLDYVIATGLAYNRSPSTVGTKGFKFTADQRIALSAALKGKEKSAAHRAALAEGARRRWAKVPAADRIERMAEMGRGNLGKPKSAEHSTNIARARRRLTEAQVTEIRDRYATGSVLQSELAAEFGVHQGTISNVVRGRGYSQPA